MRLFQLKINNEPFLAVEKAKDEYCLISDMGLSCRTFADLITAGKAEQERIRNIVNNGIDSYPVYFDKDVSIYSPIKGPTQDIICLGVNYTDHAKEVAKDLKDHDQADTIYFSKRVYRTVGDGGMISSHSDIVSQLDYEAELLVIIGRDVYGVSEEDALDCIFGYSVINDVSARDLQMRHKQWYRGKSLDGFTAIGPCIVTADEISDVQDLEISCTVNGEVRQQSNTKYMIKNIAAAIAELSNGMTLQAETMIASGTPGGVGKGMNPPCYLRHGDVVSCSVEGIGRLTNTID